MRFAKHDITIEKTAGVTRTPDGLTTTTVTKTFSKGIASLLGAHEQFIASQQGRTVSIAVQVPANVVVDTKDNIIVGGTGALGLDGYYTVIELRPDRATKRLLCARYEVQAT